MKRFNAFRNILVEKWIKIWSVFDQKAITSALTTISRRHKKKVVIIVYPLHYHLIM